jgi:uncharacterized protein (DUF488 family)
MESVDTQEQRGLYTVGHSNHALEDFVRLLQSHAVQVLVDVRSSPHSRYVPHFNRESLHAALREAGMRYLFLGKELGGRPEGDDFYDEDGFVLYSRVAESPLFLAGIDRLEAGIRRYRVAIMCSEEDPAVCHRHLLVGRVMAERGAEITHIRGDGSLQTDSDLRPAGYEQPFLFDLPKEDTWKSLRSVLPGKRPKNSSSSSDATGSDDWSMSG